jgi:hypothetical protein
MGRDVTCPKVLGIAFSKFIGEPVSGNLLEKHEIKFGFPQIISLNF